MKRLAATVEGKKLLRLGAAVTLLLTFGVQCGCKAEAPWPLWESYAAKFVDGQGRVIDHDAHDHTTTEGQAYAMFFALVANDRKRFEKLLAWTETNLAGGDLTARLPAWRWGRADDGSWRTLDANPASDADLWMAYALCEAGRLWSVPRYEKLGSLMASRVAHEETAHVPGIGTVLLPGPQGFHPEAKNWYVNPSYTPPFLLAYFARRSQPSPWKEIADALPQVVYTPGGFAMDWVLAGEQGVRPAFLPGTGQPGGKPVGSYDAIRVYLWLGMSDPKTAGVRQTLDRVMGMAMYLGKSALPPLRVDGDGAVLAPDGPVGFSAAVIPYLHTLDLNTAEQAQADRVTAMRDAGSGLYGKDGRYYDQNLVMFSTGWSEQRFRFEVDGKLKVKWK